MNPGTSRLALLNVSLLLSVACGSSQPPGPTARPPQAIEGGGCDTAVVIDAPNEREGIAAEYQWLSQKHPGFKRLGQSLGACKGFRSDFVHIETATGEKRTVVFNIDSFFGRW